MQFEYVNPLAGLVMLIIGLLLMIFIHWIYGMAPAVAGIALIVYYRKHLFQILGEAY